MEDTVSNPFHPYVFIYLQFVTCDSLEDDVEKLKKERNEALKEMSKLKVTLLFICFKLVKRLGGFLSVYRNCIGIY